MIKLDMLRCFSAVATAGGLAGAADALGRTPAAISMQLKQLEAEVGGRLFETDRKTNLTRLGAFVLGQAEREVVHFDRTIATIRDYSTAGTGLVRIASTPSVAETFLPGVVAAYCRDHPHVQIEIGDMDSASVIEVLANDQADIGFATGQDARVTGPVMLTDPFGIVSRDDDKIASHAPAGWSDVAQRTVIANGLFATLPDPAAQSIAAAAKLTVRNTTSLMAMVRAGLGITILPRLTMTGGRPGLHFRPLSDQSAVRQIRCLRAANASPTPAVLAFQDMAIAMST
ncbi:MAG: LysR substrate-binding domain-containing protein [Pikeienuella sp.]